MNDEIDFEDYCEINTESNRDEFDPFKKPAFLDAPFMLKEKHSKLTDGLIIADNDVIIDDSLCFEGFKEDDKNDDTVSYSDYLETREGLFSESATVLNESICDVTTSNFIEDSLKVKNDENNSTEEITNDEDFDSVADDEEMMMLTCHLLSPEISLDETDFQNLPVIKDFQSRFERRNLFANCSDCDKSLIAYTTFRLHLVKDHSISEYEADELVLKQWIEKKMQKDEKTTKLPCPWCHENFISFEDYYKHLHFKHFFYSFAKYCLLVSMHIEEGVLCPLCEDSVNSVSLLEEHLESAHSDVSIRICLLCEETCGGKGALLRHINHHIMGVQKCPICSCRYSTQRQVSSHLEFIHKNKYSVKCTECSQCFDSYSNYESHKEEVHKTNEENGENCLPLIGRKLETDSVIKLSKQKINIEPNSSLAFCDLCKLSFTFKSQYERHLYSNHPHLFKYRCEECECLFKNYGGLISHQISHFFGLHHCPHCNAKFSKVDQIKKHLKFSHPFVKGLECKLCVKNFKTYDTYLNHLKLKHPEVSGKAILNVHCTVCQKSFANNHQLQLHARNHQKEMSVCTICGMKVKYMSSHMNSHTKDVVYKCQDCDAKYSNKSSLIFHRKRIHLGDLGKKFSCEDCSKKFISKDRLEVHVSRVHHGERNYKCNFCDKTYKNRVSLTYHVRKHTGYKPHECTFCHKSFEIPTSLKQHVEKDHKAMYKGVYYKKKNSQIQIEDEVDDFQQEEVHINIPSDMRKEVVIVGKSA
ncbi:Zinc finger protein [Armadillidium vulgare]|nr:Zinc finger protein [Armadillidium vulgare]